MITFQSTVHTARYLLHVIGKWPCHINWSLKMVSIVGATRASLYSTSFAHASDVCFFVLHVSELIAKETTWAPEQWWIVASKWYTINSIVASGRCLNTCVTYFHLALVCTGKLYYTEVNHIMPCQYGYVKVCLSDMAQHCLIHTFILTLKMIPCCAVCCYPGTLAQDSINTVLYKLHAHNSFIH